MKSVLLAFLYPLIAISIFAIPLMTIMAIYFLPIFFIGMALGINEDALHFFGTLGFPIFMALILTILGKIKGQKYDVETPAEIERKRQREIDAFYQSTYQE